MIHALIGLLVFAFFALGGVIVDVGFARLTQRQMWVATDAAAMEGVRLQDTVGTDPGDELVRRQAVERILEDHFDDDFGATATDRMQYGAGPLVGLGPGIGSTGAGRPILVDPNAPVFKPSLQLNLADARYGDQLPGTFDVSDLAHQESSTYARTDFFSPTEPVPAGADPRDAYLVRLRRTRSTNPLDAQPGISSHGPELPYLFARGSTMAPEAKERGINVRATSIAIARRATLVGVPDPQFGLPGYPPFLLEYDYWNSLPQGQTLRLRFAANGEMVGSGRNAGPTGGPPQPNPYFPYADRGGPPIIPPGQINGGSVPVGVLADRLGSAYQRHAWSIGDEVIQGARRSDATILDWLGNPQAAGYVAGRVYFYVPIYDGVVAWDGRPGRQPGEAFKEGNARVVGFGTIAIQDADIDGFDEEDEYHDLEIEIVKLPSYVAPLNASAVEAPGLATGLPSVIMDLYRQLDGPVRAAALAH